MEISLLIRDEENALNLLRSSAIETPERFLLSLREEFKISKEAYWRVGNKAEKLNEKREEVTEQCMD